MKFKPALIPTIFTIFGLILLINLGLWQLRRHDTAQIRKAETSEKLASPPATNSELTQSPGPILHWRKAKINGRFLDVPPSFVSGRFEFGEPGFDVYQPFVLSPEHVLLVNRGWIPSTDYTSHLRSLTEDLSSREIQGLLLEMDSTRDPALIPGTSTLPERWPKYSEAAIAARYGSITLPWVLTEGIALKTANEKSREPLPATGYIAKPKSIPHLEYAWQWFGIATVLLTVWFAMGVKRARKQGTLKAGN